MNLELTGKVAIVGGASKGLGRACAEVLCLPCHPDLVMADVDRVCAAILGWSRA